MTFRRSSRVAADGAELWDAAADERQWLADEREQLSNERESLANERERLADEHERLLDERNADHAEDVDLGRAPDEQSARVEAEGTLARAEARLQRALAEQARAELALERQACGESRARRDALRQRDRQITAATPETTSRPGGVRAPRPSSRSNKDRLCLRRCVTAPRTPGTKLASMPGTEAPIRAIARRGPREDAAARRETEQLRGAASATAHERVLRARDDLSEVRESADRQRRNSARLRQVAAIDRAEASGRAASFIPDACGPQLRAQFMELTRELFVSQQLSDIADRAIGFALECLPEYVAAGVTIVQGGVPVLRTASDPVADRLDAIQIETGHGPAFEAFASPEPVHATSFAAWPDVSVVAAELRIEGVLAYGLSVPRDGTWQSVGILTFYADVDAARVSDPGRRRARLR